jgi:hypothetical protein
MLESSEPSLSARLQEKDKNMAQDLSLSRSTVIAVMHVPLEKVDIADWLFNLPDAEYQRCSSAHIAAGVTVSDSDHRCRSMSRQSVML